MNQSQICLSSHDAGFRLVLLHGWGSDAEDLIPVGKELSEIKGRRLEIVSLQAPEIHPQGTGYQWYDLFPADWSAVPQAIEDLRFRLKKLSSHEIPLSKTFVLGFSQGGAMAIHSAFNLEIAGIIAFSAYPHPGWAPSRKGPAVFLAHGLADNIVPITASEKLFSMLSNDQLEVDIFKFSGGHEITQECIIKAKEFLLKNIIL